MKSNRSNGLDKAKRNNNANSMNYDYASSSTRSRGRRAPFYLKRSFGVAVSLLLVGGLTVATAAMVRSTQSDYEALTAKETTVARPSAKPAKVAERKQSVTVKSPALKTTEIKKPTTTTTAPTTSLTEATTTQEVTETYTEVTQVQAQAREAEQVSAETEATVEETEVATETTTVAPTETTTAATTTAAPTETTTAATTTAAPTETTTVAPTTTAPSATEAKAVEDKSDREASMDRSAKLPPADSNATTSTTVVQTTAATTTSSTEAPAIKADLPVKNADHVVKAAKAAEDKAKNAAKEKEDAVNEARAQEASYQDPIENIDDDTMAIYMGVMACECGANWDYDGCLMIAQVIANRVHSGMWGDSLYNVLTAPGQFTTYSSGMWQTRQPTEAQRKAALDALKGKTIIDKDVLFFCTDAAYARSSYFKTLNHRETYANTLFFSVH